LNIAPDPNLMTNNPSALVVENAAGKL